jgi:protocatechuate 3,4-dioxygenase beta subunit
MKAAAESARTVSQREITAQIARISADHHGAAESQPRLDYPPYRSSLLRHPRSSFVCVDPEEVERWAPCLGRQDVDPLDADLTAGHRGEPIGERSSGYRFGIHLRGAHETVFVAYRGVPG